MLIMLRPARARLGRLSPRLLLPLVLPAPALAAPAEAPPIVVTGRISAALTADLPEDARRAADRIPGGASIIDLAGEAGRRSATLADVLRLAPGVFAAPRFGPEDLRISVRGSGIVRTGHAKGLLVLRDGVPLNAADGEFDALSLDIGVGSHLALLRGPAALGVGATTLGGAIVLESRTGRTAPGLALEASGGSFETWGARASAGLTGRAVDGFLGFGTSGTRGFRQHAATRGHRLAGNIGWRIAPEVETRLFAGHSDVETEWPGVLTRAEYEADPRQASLFALRRDQDNNIRQTHVASRTVLAAGPARVTLALGHDRRFKDHATIIGILEETNASLTGALVGEIAAPPGAPARGSLTLGVRAMRTDQDRRVFAFAGGLLSPNSARKGPLTSSRDRRASNLELFGRAELELAPGLSASGALAHVSTDRSDRPGPGNPPGGDPPFEVAYDEVLPGLGLVWRPGETAIVFAGWARSFEAPSFFDLGGNAPLQPDRIPRLRAQTAETVEAGTRGRAGPLRWDVTLFHSRIEGELLRLDAAGALNPPIVNAGKTRRTGLESAVLLDPGPALGLPPGRLQLAAKWDWLDARFDSDPVYGTRRVAGVPEHSAYLELSAEPAPGLVLRPHLVVRSRTETDLFNTPGAAAGGFVLVGANLRFERGPVLLWLDARNLADRRHVSAVNVVNRATPTAALFFPGDGRAVYAGLALRF